MSELWNEIFAQDDAPITENFDPTWPFNFKWAFDPQTGRTDVWRTKGGIDGVPSHRAEVQDRWGRKVRVQDGDVLGLASYIPAEVKLTGEVVAPPEVQIQPYYVMQVPPQIKQWFEDQFPDAAVRETTIVKPRMGKTAGEWDFLSDKAAPMPESEKPVLKWLWNERDGLLLWEVKGEEGLPTHNQKCMAEWHRTLSISGWGDMLGYAVPDTPEPGVITVESYDGRQIPAGAYQAVKTQLSEWFPHDQVITDDGVEQHAFNSNPQDYRTAALDWAWEHLSDTPRSLDERPLSHLETTKGKSGLLARLFSKSPVWQRTADADMEGAMVALFLPKDAAKKLKVRGGEPVENMHITLLYFADKAADRDDWDEVKKIVEQVANQTPTLSGKVSGYGVFNSDDGDVLWASPSVQGLAELRHKLYEACEDAGFHVNTEHDWVPHITLKYDHKGKLPKDEGVELEFASLGFTQGEDMTDYEFSGNFEKHAAQDYQYDNDFVDNTWSYTHRTPYIYLPHKDALYMGAPGLYHYTLNTWAQQRGFDPDNDPSIYGSVYNHNGEKFQEVHTEQWPNAWSKPFGEMSPEQTKRLVDRIGAPFGESNVADMNDDDLEDYWSERFGSAPTEPPNYREQEKPDEACHLCKMMFEGKCWGYGNKPVEPDMVCDSFTPDKLEKRAMAADPEWVRNWIRENGPYLYHGSGGRDQFGDPRQILQQGIVPRSVGRDPDIPRAEDYGWDGTNPYDYPADYDAEMDEWWHHPRPGHTYLTTNPEDAYGTHLFRVDIRGLDPANFNADDDYLRETGDTIGPLIAPGQEYRDLPGSPFQDWDEVRKNLKTLGEQAEEQDWGSNPEDTHDSWESHPVHHDGVVAYRGTIPPHLIEHAATRPDRGEAWQYQEGFSSPVNREDYQPQSIGDGVCEQCGQPWSDHEPTYDQQTGVIGSLCPGQKTSSQDYLDWGGWDGAHRFVTDGKEILTDPETERIDEKVWAFPEELGEKFRSFHPDSKGFASGWILPTADGMGVGIYAPAAGHGDEHEPGMHDIIKVIEKQYGKPAHFITNPDHLSDDKMYSPNNGSEWQTIS